MKIAVFEVESWETKAFNRLKWHSEVVLVEDMLTPDNAHAFSDADIICVSLGSTIDANILKRFEHLRLVATRSTGFEHIDVEYCREHNICVSNVPGYGENTAAEHVFGLILTISHHLYDAIERTRRGDFSQEGLRGFDLKGKTLGVIGTGSIGRNVIGIAKAFGMNVTAFDTRPDKRAADRMGFHYRTMDELLASSDIITLHLPINSHNRGLISSEQFDRMKRGVILINTERASLIDTKALLAALEEGKVAAAGLDVLPEEPAVREEAELIRAVVQESSNIDTLLAAQVLLRFKNVFITPHTAFNTKEAISRILDATIESITEFVKHKEEKDMIVSCT